MKRLIGMMLTILACIPALVVICLGLLFMGFMFLGIPDAVLRLPNAVLRLIENDSSMLEMDSFLDMEPDLVRNENGEVIEFTGYYETDADLEQLRDMPELETPDLGFCEKITDAGLVHLKGMTNLQDLALGGANITESGVAELQKALPNCVIIR